MSQGEGLGLRGWPDLDGLAKLTSSWFPGRQLRVPTNGCTDHKYTVTMNTTTATAKSYEHL